MEIPKLEGAETVFLGEESSSILGLNYELCLGSAWWSISWVFFLLKFTWNFRRIARKDFGGLAKDDCFGWMFGLGRTRVGKLILLIFQN